MTSSVNSLLDKTFLVEDILNKDGQSIKELNSKANEPIFQL